MPRADAAPGERLRALWRRLAPLPGGKTLFAFLLGRRVPYTGRLGARVETLEPGHCRATLRDRRAVRNHLDSVHAMALATLAELASGLAVLTGLAPGVRGILTGFSVTYVKKARGRVTAECRVGALTVSAEREHDAEVTLTDAAGDAVARGTARWRLRPPDA
jgi:acyl-coenzyme A thioesterase PaaI-like protein